MRPNARIIAAALVTVLVAAGCATRREIDQRRSLGTDRTLSTFAFIEEGRIASLIVDTRATRLRSEAPYLPIEVCFANLGLKQMTLTRESFTLVDDAGNRYPVAGPTELMDGYEFLDFDRRLGELPDIVFNRFANFTPYPSLFSPVREPVRSVWSSSIVRDRVTLPKFGYMIDFLYFPTPPGGVLDRRFELHVRVPEHPDPIFVKFAVR